jgi:hypothetical protein
LNPTLESDVDSEIMLEEDLQLWKPKGKDSYTLGTFDKDQACLENAAAQIESYGITGITRAFYRFMPMRKAWQRLH